MSLQVKDDRFYTTVAANDTENSDYIVPSGKKIQLRTIGGDAAFSEDVKIEVWWDKGGAEETLLLVTNGDANQTLNFITLTGNGTRAIQILLTNDKGVSCAAGGFWSGETYDA